MTNLSASLIRITVLALALAGTAYASGGPFGGSIYALRADPANASRVYATTSNGIFRSDDAGVTWASKEVGLTAPHPSNGVLVFGASTLWTFDNAGQLHRSTNAGDAWVATGYTAPGGVLGAAFYALAEGDSTKVWFAAGTHGLLVSNDSGATFTAAAGVPAGQTFVSVATDPANRAHVIASTTTSCDSNAVCPIYVSTNGGASWSTATLSGTLPASGGGFAQHVVAAAYASGATYALYGDPNFQQCSPTCVRVMSVLRSTDGGLSWSGHSVQEIEPPASIAVSPASNNTVWVDANKSIDGGATFAPLSSSGRTTNGTLVPTVSTVAVSAGYGTTPRLWLGTQFAGVYATSNDGASWSASDEGLEATDIRSVVVSPADSSVVYAGYGDSLQDPSQALFRSGAGGAWSTSNHLLNAYQLRTVLIDPTTASTVGGSTIYAVGSGYDNSSAFYVHPSARNSGIYKSTDGGANWTMESGGIPTFVGGGVYAGFLRTIIADPRSCAGSSGPTGAVCASGPLQTLYVTGSGRSNSDGTHPYRVMKSIDGGVNWADSSTGLPDDIVSEPTGCPAEYVGGVTPIVMDPADSRVLYIGTFAEAFDTDCNAIPPTIASGVYKSIDAGAHWTWSSAGLRNYDGTTAGSSPGGSSVLDTLSLAIDASNPNTLWVSTNDGNGGFGAPGELFKSTDAGAHWTLSNAGVTGPDVRALLADPTHPGTVYAASGGIDAADPGGVFKSTDAGATWQSISVGLPAFSATALALDPQDSSILYAGTTGGVYSLAQATDTDGDGVPDAVEDAGANNGDANNDGTKDRFQANVATVPAALVGTYGWHSGVAGASRPAARAQTMSDFFIKALPAGSGTDCQRTVDTSMIDASTLGADSVAHHGTYTYPNGLARFELPQCAAANVDVVYASATFGPGWTWRYYGPSVPGDVSTIGWHDASSLLTSRVNGDWKIHLANGQFGSYRPAAAGSILFEGGPAYNETIFTDNLEP
jgi:hypothetical protein